MKSSTLFTLATALFVPSTIYIVVSYTYPKIGYKITELYSQIAFLLSLSFFIAALFKRYSEKNTKTVNFLLNPHECLVTASKERNGRETTSISFDTMVSNVTTGKGIYIYSILIKTKKIKIEYIQNHLQVREYGGRHFGKYMIPPQHITPARGNIIIEGNHIKEIRSDGIEFELMDQYENIHLIQFSPNQIKTDALHTVLDTEGEA